MTDIPWSTKGSKSTIDTTDELMLFVPSEPIAVDKNKTITGENIQVYTENITLHTGVRKGMALTINADTTRFDVAAGTVIKVDRTDPLNVIVTSLNFAGLTAQLDTNLTATFSHVFIDEITGVVTTELNGPLSLTDLTNRIYLGQLVHNASVIVNIFINSIVAHGSTISEMAMMVFSGGVRLNGVMISGGGADLTVNVTSGILQQYGRSFDVDPNTPNNYDYPVRTPLPLGQLVKAFVDGIGNLVLDRTTNTINPAQFDEDGLGTLVNVSPAGDYTVIRVFASGGNDAIFYYGTARYANAEAALAAPEPTFVEHIDTIQLSPIAYIAIKGNVTDLTAALASGDAVVMIVSRRN